LTLLAHVNDLAALVQKQQDLLHALIDEEGEDESEDGSKSLADPKDYPEPRWDYKATKVAWVKPGTPIEHMTAVGNSFILRRLTEMIMSQRSLDNILEEFHGNRKWPTMAAAGYPPVKQYPWSSRMNQHSIEAISVHASGNPPRLTKTEIETITQRLEMWGVAVIQNAATAEHCDDAREWLRKEIKSPTARFGNVRSPAPQRTTVNPNPIAL